MHNIEIADNQDTKRFPPPPVLLHGILLTLRKRGKWHQFLLPSMVYASKTDNHMFKLKPKHLRSPVSFSLSPTAVPMTSGLWWAGADFLADQRPLKFYVSSLTFNQNVLYQLFFLSCKLTQHKLFQNKASRTICRWCWQDFYEQVLSFVVFWVFWVWALPSIPYIGFLFSSEFFAWKSSTGPAKVIAVKSNVMWPVMDGAKMPA